MSHHHRDGPGSTSTGAPAPSAHGPLGPRDNGYNVPHLHQSQPPIQNLHQHNASMTGTPTAGSSASAATTTANNVQLSSTTIVALGMGFIGAALLVVGITVLLRVLVVQRAAAHARARGENVTFRDMWERWGGVWGLLFAPGEQLTGWGDGVVVRRRNIGPPPKMWDVDVAQLEPKDEFDLNDESAQPLAAAPYYAPGSNVPECAFSVLIVMPAPPLDPLAPSGSIPRSHGDEEEEPQLPDVMLGTTHLQPTIPLSDAGIKRDDGSDYDYVVHEITRVQTRRPTGHWAVVWGMDAGGRIP